MPGVHTEKAFEDAIEDHLLSNGWLRGTASNYDPNTGLDSFELFSFISATQQKSWQNLVIRHGSDEQVTKSKFTTRLVGELSKRGTIEVLRHGIEDMGVKFHLAYFKPAHSLTLELEQNYQANRCTVTRQLSYSAKNKNSLDLTLFLNGIPTMTAEIKNPLTGQNVEHAIKQYRQDRNDPKDLMLSKRALVHFALDPDQVFLTTALMGPKTVFLPFNKGKSGGYAGNDPNPNGYTTSYLWEQIWQRDSFLDIVDRYVHVQPDSVVQQINSFTDTASTKKKSPNIIFPRYHQLDAVRKIITDTKQKGPGNSYLIQHSAGSGKSNTIAWLAHRLSNLFDNSDNKIFSKVIVITDRRALDRQLQDTIFQFDHVAGVVTKIDKDSSQLSQALSNNTSKIIITTLQKFPFVIDKLASLQSNNFAVIIDEAHSSQGGESAKALKVVLSKTGHPEASELEVAEYQDGTLEAASDDDDLITYSVNSRSRADNLSYFAFTSTPKQKTLELFGTKTDDGLFSPFHLYSMRQAIEEGFILDVLENYSTYSTYWKVAKKIDEDPEVPQKQAAKEIAKYVYLHPSNLAQKAEIMIEHFRRHSANKIGGKAKAMVVTRSRLHAVRYKQTFDRYIKEHNYQDVHCLVAFSGKVFDSDNAQEFTESNMNGFAESQLVEKFKKDDYQILIVAEKYQTGYDEPLLHTMYVDKKLSGIKAVQTLSRLNRIHLGKEDTFVLDFANDAENIQLSFKPFYDTTIAQPTDPNVLSDLANELRGFGVISDQDCKAFAKEFLKSDPKDKKIHQNLYIYLQPAQDLYQKLEKQAQFDFTHTLNRFIRQYSFLSQILPWADPDLEVLYLYCRYLIRRLPKDHTGSLDLGEDLVLTHLRIQDKGKQKISLRQIEPDLVPLASSSGTAAQPEPKQIQLSSLIESLNELFGTDFTETDQLFFDQIQSHLTNDETIQAQARANSLENFRYGFDPACENAVIDRSDMNNKIFRRFFNDKDFAKAVTEYLAKKVYEDVNGG